MPFYCCLACMVYGVRSSAVGPKLYLSVASVPPEKSLQPACSYFFGMQNLLAETKPCLTKRVRLQSTKHTACTHLLYDRGQILH